MMISVATGVPSADQPTGPPAVTVRSLYRFFRDGDDETFALRGVSMEIATGELVAVVGPSGSGKSTLLACIAGLDEPSGGSVWIGDQRMSHQPEPVRTRLRADRVGFLGQSRNLFEHFTMHENLRFVRSLSGRRPAAGEDDLLGALGIGGRADAYPSELSGGELARAGLAVAMANDPAVLLADEPTGELDSTAEASLVDLIADLARAGRGVLVASHSQVVAERADRVVRLEDGAVAE
jgi:putative ABC transport system ATP-binding protein